MTWLNPASVLLLLLMCAVAAADEWVQLDAQAVSQYRSGDYDAALVTAQQALALAERDQTGAVGGARLATSLNALALIHQAQGHYAEAQALLEQALAVSEQALPADHPNIAALRANLASVQNVGRQQEAERMAQRAQALNEEALALHARGEYAQAATRYEEALPIVAQHFGADSVEVARVLASLADTHVERKQYPQAEALYQQALSIFAQHDEEVVARANALNALAVAHYLQRHYGKAEPLFQQSLVLLEAALGPEHPDLLPMLDNLVALYRTTYRERQAEPLVRRATQIRKAHGLALSDAR